MNLVRHTFTPLQHLLAALAIFAMIMAPMAQVFAEDTPEGTGGQTQTQSQGETSSDDSGSTDGGEGSEGDGEGEGEGAGGTTESVGEGGGILPMVMSLLKSKPQEQSRKVEICHYNNGQGGSYEKLDVSLKSTGPVGHGDEHTSDIVPPFDKDGNAHSYAKNWDTEHQTIWDNGCVDNDNGDDGDCDNDDDCDDTDDCQEYCNDDCDKDDDSDDCEDNCHDYGCGDTCDTYPKCHDDEDVATIVAHKIVCTDEAELPNWGLGSADIGASTASDWVKSHKSCKLASGWSFEWVLNSEKTDPGDTLVGPANAPWTTFGPTNESGEATATLSKDQLEKNKKVWFREVLQNGYIPFTHNETPNNTDTVTAEFYCNNDILNYDNLEWIDGIDPEKNKTYHCVAWNVPETGSITIEKKVRGEVSAWSFGFTGLGEGFTLTNEDSSETFSELTAGEYAINEIVPKGYELTSVTCNDNNSIQGEEDDLVVSLEAGEDVTCTFVNTEVPVIIDECPVEKSLLTNGSFESDAVTSASLWQKFSSVTGWLVEKRSDATATTLELHKGWSANVAAQGAQYTELDGDEPTRIEQSVTTEPGATYKLFWAFAPRQSTAAAENNLSIEVEGSQVATEGPAAGIGVLAANSWTHGSYQFVAGDASTEIAFKDLGPEAVGSGADVGTFLDDVRLCKVKDPVPPETCTVTLVSGAENTTVTEKAGAFAQVLSFVHSAWTATLGSAQWIWGDNPVAAPVVGVEQTFVRNFGWGGTSVTSATLYVAADNSYSSTMNGDASGTDANVMNFTPATQDSYDVTSLIDNGNNALSIKVLNTAGASDPAGNPAGLMYKLVIEGTGTNCDIPYNDGDPVTHTITGFKWNDTDKDGVYDEGESKLPGWTITATEDADVSEPVTYSTTTNADGHYSIEVPAGSWIVNETQQSGWTQSAPATPGTCSFTFGEPVPARVAKVAYDTVVNNVCNFGNYQNSNDDGDDEDLSCTLTSNKASVSSGETFTLSWTTDYATDVTITGLSGELALDGSQDTSTTGDTTYTLTATRYVNDAPEQVICSVDVDVTSSSHHHSSGSRKKSSTGTVLGDSTERPETAVLGASTAMPVGAPDTGAGGTSPVSVSVPTLLAVLGSRASVRKTN